MSYLYPTITRSVSLFLSQLKSHAAPVRSTCIITPINDFKQPIRFLCLSTIKNAKGEAEVDEDGKEVINPILLRHPERDRRKRISVETSIRYLKSSAFKEAYGNNPVWFQYRRNHKGSKAPKRTRKLCVRGDIVATGNPCPICRDEYLIVDYTNLDLLKQFISPVTGNIISYEQTGVCQKQHEKLLVAFERAKDLGLLTFDVPFRSYDYSEYISE